MTEPENGADIVVLPDTIQHHRYRSARQRRERRPIRFYLAQLRARQWSIPFCSIFLNHGRGKSCKKIRWRP